MQPRNPHIYLVGFVSAAILTGCVSGGGSPPQPEGNDNPADESVNTKVSALVGPRGGSLSMRNGFKLSIPAGALGSEINIVAEQIANEEGSQPVFRVEPAGTKFNGPVQVTLPTNMPELPPDTDMLWQGYRARSEGGDYAAMDKVAQSEKSVTSNTDTLGYYTSGSPLANVIVTGEDYPRRIASDGSHVYWSSDGNQRHVTNSRGGIVARAPIAGGLIQVLAPPQPDPMGVAVNDTHVYWTNAGDGDLWPGQGTGGGVMRVPKNGSGAAERLVDQGFPQAIALDAESVYWTEADAGDVRKMPLNGGSVSVLASNQGDVRHMALDGTHVYFTTGERGVVAKVAKTGGTPVILSSEGGNTTSVVVADGNVYWTNEGTGRVRRISVGGGNPTTVRSATQPAAVTVHGGRLYFADRMESSIYSLPAAGGTATVIAMDQQIPWSIHVHGDTKQLVWATAGLQDFTGGLIKFKL